jgi:hypothetical protein
MDRYALAKPVLDRVADEDANSIRVVFGLIGLRGSNMLTIDSNASTHDGHRCRGVGRGIRGATDISC